MAITREFAEHVCAILNEALEVEPIAVSRLMMRRELLVNETLGDHPTIQCKIEHDKRLSLGCLGVINGLFGADSTGAGMLYMTVDRGSVARFNVREDFLRELDHEELQQAE